MAASLDTSEVNAGIGIQSRPTNSLASSDGSSGQANGIGWHSGIITHIEMLGAALAQVADALEPFPWSRNMQRRARDLRLALLDLSVSLLPDVGYRYHHYSVEFGRVGERFHDFFQMFLRTLEVDDSVTPRQLARIQDDLDSWRLLVHRGGGDGRFYLHSNADKIRHLAEELDFRIVPLTVLLNNFVNEGIHVVKRNWVDSERQFKHSLQSLSTMATFLSAVTATTLQFSYQNQETRAEQAVNLLWLISLSFSIAGATNSQLAYYLDLARYRAPQWLIARWALVCITGTPVIYIVVAVITFSAGLVCFTFVTFPEHRFILLTIATLTCFVWFALFSVILSFAVERHGEEVLQWIKKQRPILRDLKMIIIFPLIVLTTLVMILLEYCIWPAFRFLKAQVVHVLRPLNWSVARSPYAPDDGLGDLPAPVSSTSSLPRIVTTEGSGDTTGAPPGPQTPYIAATALPSTPPALDLSATLPAPSAGTQHTSSLRALSMETSVTFGSCAMSEADSSSTLVSPLSPSPNTKENGSEMGSFDCAESHEVTLRPESPLLLWDEAYY